MLHKLLVILFLCLFALPTSYSQQPTSFSKVSVDDGLSQSDINTIYQSTDGYMWFGTHDGLNKYDGYTFTQYKPKHKDITSIASNLIFTITGDPKRNLWIGSTGSGLSFFDVQTEKFTNFKHNSKNKKSIISNFVTTSFYDSQNRLWIGTNKGLDMLNATKSIDSIVFNHIVFPEENLKGVHDIYEDATSIYVAIAKHIYKMNKTDKKLRFKEVKHQIPLSQNGSIKKITHDKYHRLITGTSEGVFISVNNKLHQINNITCSTILVDNTHNTIWIGTNIGLYQYHLGAIDEVPTLINTFKNDPKDSNSLSKNNITSLYKDTFGIIWVGTNGGGLNKYDPYKKPFYHIRRNSHKHSISYDKIRSVFEDSNGTLWIGTEGGGLNFETPQTTKEKYQQFKKLNSPKINNPFALNEINIDGKKMLFIGSSDKKQLTYIDISNTTDLENRKIKNIPEVKNGVFAIEVDHENYVWVGTYNNGVFVYQYTNNQFQLIHHFKASATSTHSIANNIIRSIFQDSQKNIWIATGNGLSKLAYANFKNKTYQFTSYHNNPNDDSSISHNYILAIHEDQNKNLWFGTFGGGLSKLVSNPLETKATFKNFDKNDGLPNNVIKGILEDSQGNLWLSSNMGLSKFDVEQEIFKNYNKHDGLQSNEFQELACYKRKNGEMVFGGINGFNAFFPEKIKDNPYKPTTVLTNIALFNKNLVIGETDNGVIHLKKSIGNTKKITFNYNQNNLSFKFSGLQYSSPVKNQYAYMLSNFENEWNYTDASIRVATYTNLPSGIYTFKVKASNGDGVWNNETKNIVIKISPPFWKTIWAYVLYVLLVLILLTSLWKFTIIRTEKKHELELEHLEKEKHQELQHMKMEFFTNISHEFRTPLTLLKGPIEYLQKKGEKLDYNVVKNQYQLMDKNINYLLRLVTQLLDFQKMDKGQMGLTIYEKNISKFVKEVAQPFQFISEKKNIHYTVRTESDEIQCYFSPDALEKVMNNLLSNAFKFCPENGTIDVYIYVKKTFNSDRLTKKSVYNRVVIEVKDSGSGISDSKKERIFKRFYSNSAKELANPTGTGIGLSYTKSLIDLHQGSIVVIDNELGGTTFAINIPQEQKAYKNKPNITLAKKEETHTATNAYAASSLDIAVTDEKNDEEIVANRPELPIILVVDDNKDIRTFIKQSLKDQYNILEAENGAQGYELAKSKIPNIIISDYVMPEMDGAAFCEKCKNTAEISHIPFILLTAKTSKENEFDGLQSGADDYVTKPFNLELLELKIKNIIGKRDKLRKKFNQEIILKPEEVTVTSADELFLEKAMEVVEKNMMNTEFSVEMLVQEMSVSRSNLYLKLKEITGLSSSEFIRSIRLKRAVQLLESSDLSVKEIMYMTGFNSPSYFAKCFKKQFNMTPSDYIHQNTKRQNNP